MTEVPEYLLRRSKERREALGLVPTGSSGPAEGGAASAAVGAPGAPSATAIATAALPAVAAATTAASAPTPKGVAPPEVKPAPTGPVWPRNGIPVWMMPVLLVLPLWAIVYTGIFGERGEVVLTGAELGAQVYRTAGCVACHGATGGGGVGPALAGGEAKLTFPNEADHISWVETGSGPFKGKPYGDPGRAGGPRIATSGGMPGYAGQLSPEEIAAVVLYERTVL